MHGNRCYGKLAEKRPPALLDCDGDRPSPPDGSGDGTDFVLAEWTDAGESSAERPIAPLHLHRSDDEAWYVLDGTLGFVRGDERSRRLPGSAVLVPRGVVHTFWNAGPTRRAT